MAVATEALITLAEGKAALKITGSDEDAYLEVLIDDISFSIEAECQNVFVARSVTSHIEIHGSAQKDLHLDYAPVNSVTSITDLDSGTVAATEYWIVPGLAGVLRYKGLGFPEPKGNVYTVVYNAGAYVDTAAIPNQLKRAAITWLRILYANPDPRVTSKSIGKTSITRRAQDDPAQVPDEVRPFLNGFYRHWV